MGKSKKKTDGDMKKNGDRVSKWKQVFNRENSFYDEVSYVFFVTDVFDAFRNVD